MGHTDETEWAALEQDAPQGYSSNSAHWSAVYEGPAFKDAPHPQSYGAKLPMRGLGRGTEKSTHKWTLTAAEKKATEPVKALPCPIKPNSAHPSSYRADLPLRGLRLNGPRATHRWTLTKEEKEALAGRPLQYRAVA